jgi:hypothetical protein
LLIPLWKQLERSQMSQLKATAETRATSNRVSSAIASAAQRVGVNFDYLYNQARIESNFDPAAQAKTSSATGLFQFTDQTWLATLKSHGPEHGLDWAAAAIAQSPSGQYHLADPSMRDAVLDLRNDPEVSSAMAAEFASDNQSTLETNLNRNIEPVDLYLAHFLGAAGATRFLTAHAQKPQQPTIRFFMKKAGPREAWTTFARCLPPSLTKQRRSHLSYAAPLPAIGRAEVTHNHQMLTAPNS